MGTIKIYDTVYITNLTTGKVEQVFHQIHRTTQFADLIRDISNLNYVAHRHPRNLAAISDSKILVTYV